MATPADQRLLELLDKWLKSLELHIKYSSLDDDSYWKVQPWVEHQRPSRWILDLARQKTVALRSQVEDRVKEGDAKFSDSLELMTFLANLVGSEHIERFIPVADPDNERALVPTAPVEYAQPDSATGTREMPKFQASASAQHVPAATAQVARSERRAAIIEAAAPEPAKTERKAPAAEPAKGEKAAPSKRSLEKAPVSDETRDLVIADAIRLVQWGRKWYELAELISRMADRPALPDVRRVLKDNKEEIDAKAGRA